MSPEQARGLAVDKRTDVWAAVLLEMLTGRPAFAGHTVSDVRPVLQQEPDWTALPSATPPAVRSLLRCCVQKEPNRRMRDIADARFQIEEALGEPAGTGAVSRPTAERYRPAGPMDVALIIAAVAGVAGGARYFGRLNPRPRRCASRSTRHPRPIRSVCCIAGRKTLVFAATPGGTSRLWLRSLDASARPLAGTESAMFPFWSPDSRSVGFSANAQLKRVDVDSGSVRVVVPQDAAGGGTWNRDGTILYDRGPGAGLFRVSADGGPRTLVIPSINGVREITRSNKEAADPWLPQFLPDQRHFLFYATGTAPGIYIGQLGASLD
jgi:hypothetical protein